MVDLQRAQRHVLACERALKEQATLIQRYWPADKVPSLAIQTLTNMEIGLVNARVHYDRTLNYTIHTLRMTLLQELAQRGRIVSEVVATDALKSMLEVLLEQEDVSLEEGITCLLLYLNWSDFCDAQRWHRAIGQLPPVTAMAAVQMFRAWRDNGRQPGDGKIV